MLLLALALLILAPAASADTLVTWTLNNFTFSDGATASGSFVYDATTNTFSSINIVTSSGTTLSGAAYHAVDPGFGPFSFDVAFVTTSGLGNYVGTDALELNFSPLSLTDGGGIVPTDINEFVCSNANCSTADDIRGSLDGGRVIGVVNTPEPAVLSLLAIGSLSLFTFRKRLSK
jgi:hypothetical protein